MASLTPHTHTLHHQNCCYGAWGEVPPLLWHQFLCPVAPREGSRRLRALLSPVQAGQPLGLSLNHGQAGPEPLTPSSAGQGEQGEGRRLEGSSSMGLAAPGSKRGGCSPWLLHCSLPTSWPAGPDLRDCLGWSTEMRLRPTTGHRPWLQHPGVGCSVAARSPECPLFSSVGLQAVCYRYPCRTHPLCCCFGGCSAGSSPAAFRLHRALPACAQLLPVVPEEPPSTFLRWDW